MVIEGKFFTKPDNDRLDLEETKNVIHFRR